MAIRVGQGYDIHQLVEGRPLILGGVSIPFDKGLLGHSDADILLHAIIDAMLGAAALGDIGKLYPDTDKQYHHMDSRILLRDAHVKVQEQGWDVVNIDSTIIAQQPKLRPYIDTIRKTIAADLNAEISMVNVKAKTNEKMGYLGRSEAMEAQAIVLLMSRLEK